MTRWCWAIVTVISGSGVGVFRSKYDPDNTNTASLILSVVCVLEYKPQSSVTSSGQEGDQGDCDRDFVDRRSSDQSSNVVRPVGPTASGSLIVVRRRTRGAVH
jgi:hypothetical protein